MASLSPISCGHQTMTIGPASAGLASPIPFAANAAEIHTSADIRIWPDGSDPTASAGMPVSAGETVLLNFPQIENFRAIAPGGIDPFGNLLRLLCRVGDAMKRIKNKIRQAIS